MAQHELQAKYKTKLCKHWAKNRRCQLAHYCSFAHGHHEIRRREDPLPESGASIQVGLLLNNYKTQMCRNMETEGVCPFGDHCVYAHSRQDLRQLTDPVPVHAPNLYIVKKRAIE